MLSLCTITFSNFTPFKVIIDCKFSDHLTLVKNLEVLPSAVTLSISKMLVPETPSVAKCILLLIAGAVANVIVFAA